MQFTGQETRGDNRSYFEDKLYIHVVLVTTFSGKVTFQHAVSYVGLFMYQHKHQQLFNQQRTETII